MQAADYQQQAVTTNLVYLYVRITEYSSGLLSKYPQVTSAFRIHPLRTLRCILQVYTTGMCEFIVPPPNPPPKKHVVLFHKYNYRT